MFLKCFQIVKASAFIWYICSVCDALHVLATYCFQSCINRSMSLKQAKYIHKPEMVLIICRLIKRAYVIPAIITIHVLVSSLLPYVCRYTAARLKREVSTIASRFLLKIG